MKVVNDTNILLIAIPSHSTYHRIIEVFNKRHFHLVITTSVFLEYEEILAEKASKFIAKNVFDSFLEAPNLIRVNTYFNWNLILSDPDNDKFTNAYLN